MYNLGLKHIAVIDALIIALGFLVRVFAGGSIAEVPVSNWLIAITICVSLLIAFGKRRDDLLLLNKGNAVRQSLDGYSLKMINRLVMLSSLILAVLYLCYTLSIETQQRIHQPLFFLTSLPAVFGILIYLNETFRKQNSGDPFEILFKNHWMQLAIISWLFLVWWFLY